jgi:crossover junction endodeoxyribonuclease RuvC
MDESQPRRILGIDPGLNTTGYGVVDVSPLGLKVCEAGIVRTPRGSLVDRLQDIHSALAEIIQNFRPECLALEELYSHYERPRTAILMGHARGVICLAASQAKIEVAHYAATKIKKMLTGNGRAPKSQMQAAICREFRLAKPPEPPDVADALAIAVCHYFATKNPILPSTRSSSRPITSQTIATDRTT